MNNTDFDTLYAAIKSGLPGVHQYDMSPADAEKLLELNVHNRKKRSVSQEQYAADMKSGRWKFAADTVKFGQNSNLLDGQHRILALASLAEEAPDLRIKFLLVTGVENDAQMVMDQGARRTAGDNIGLQGISSPNEIVAAARLYILWTTGRMFTDKKTAVSKVSNIEVQDWILANPEFIETCHFALAFRKSIDMRTSHYISAYARFKDANPTAANDFLAYLITGEHLYVGHPVHTLRERLARIRRERQVAGERDNLAFMTQAWNAFIGEQTMLRLNRPKGGTWTLANFPVVQGVEHELAA